MNIQSFHSIRIAALLLGTLAFGTAQAALYTVGNSASCTHGTLSAALFSAAVNGEPGDTIRLTREVTYTGGAEIADLVDWDPGAAGQLTLAGGYDTCSDPTASGRTVVGSTSNAVIRVRTSSRPISVVELRSLEITGGARRGLVASGGAIVSIINVRIHANESGVEARDGAVVVMDAASIIENHDNMVVAGGGVYCHGSGTTVNISGRLSANSAQRGGNLYVGGGCYVELEAGTLIEGFGPDPNGITLRLTEGGGAYVAANGELVADGASNLVVIRNHFVDDGGALFVDGSGRATLRNTWLQRNSSRFTGAAIVAQNGGLAQAQVVMDRVGTCPFLISCSRIERPYYTNPGNVVFASGSRIDLRRTIIDQGGSWAGGDGNILYSNFGLIRLDNVSIVRTESNTLLFANFGDIEGSHVTIGENYFDAGSGEPRFAWLNGGDIHFQNSIVQDTTGIQVNSGSVFGRCNLVDNSAGWPGGRYYLGTATFMDLSPTNGDTRQTANSSGVDMCNQDSFSWTAVDRDIEWQLRPVNESSNLNGYPGETGGLFDAGHDEAVINPATGPLDVTVNFVGNGMGSVSFVPFAGDCFDTCTRQFISGTAVEITPSAAPGSTFEGWTAGCDQFSGTTCRVFVTTSDRSVTVRFDEVDPDSFFEHGFENGH